ncbi:hypothetical protein [Streptomyces sp. NPDC101150]
MPSGSSGEGGHGVRERDHRDGDEDREPSAPQQGTEREHDREGEDRG